MRSIYMFFAQYLQFESRVWQFIIIRAKVTGIGKKVGTVFQSYEKSDNERTRMPIFLLLCSQCERPCAVFTTFSVFYFFITWTLQIFHKKKWREVVLLHFQIEIWNHLIIGGVWRSSHYLFFSSWLFQLFLREARDRLYECDIKLIYSSVRVMLQTYNSWILWKGSGGFRRKRNKNLLSRWFIMETDGCLVDTIFVYFAILCSVLSAQVCFSCEGLKFVAAFM